MKTQQLLMCPPSFFGVEYEINPCMRGNQGTIAQMTAQAQWGTLHRLITNELNSAVELIAPQPGLPDLVFTANAAVVHRGAAIPARFRHPERQREEPHFIAWFAQTGWTLKPLPNDGSAFE